MALLNSSLLLAIINLNHDLGAVFNSFSYFGNISTNIAHLPSLALSNCYCLDEHCIMANNLSCNKEVRTPIRAILASIHQGDDKFGETKEFNVLAYPYSVLLLLFFKR